jgi:uncharacterized heparinase superfamily protein
MTSKLLLVHTVRHLRWEQIVYRIAARLRKINVATPPVAGLARWKRPWSGALYKQPSLAADDIWTFLSQSHQVTRSSDWNNPSWSKLWLYNLHYFDDLDAVGTTQRRAQQYRWMCRWVEDNPAPAGNGWEPYTLSLRIVNWIKWLSAEGTPEPALLNSLALQTAVLRQRLEYHLLGNHLFANAKALVFAGSWFNGADAHAWLEKGLAILDREIAEQFLSDGAHFELSPMYHATLLWDMLELLELADCTDHHLLRQREPVWRGYVARGLAWLKSMCHGDGEIGFFNDAAFGIAPTPAQVAAYAQRFGFDLVPSVRPPAGAVRLKRMEASGYARIDWTDAEALLDVARVGPDYLPGHAHADSLSFEWSLRGQRVLVNSGTSQYGADAERERQRGTAAHNTVTVGAENSSEVWAGFRVARRARPVDLAISIAPAEIRVACSHDGYRRLAGRPVHRREWVARDGELRVTDSFGTWTGEAVARFHLHPDVQARVEANAAHLRLNDGTQVTMRFEGGAPVLSSGTWHPHFGESIPNLHLAVPFRAARLVTALTWKTEAS